MSVTGEIRPQAAAALPAGSHSARGSGVACRLRTWTGEEVVVVRSGGDGREADFISIHSVGKFFDLVPGLHGEHTHTFAAVAFTNNGEQNRIFVPRW